MTTFSIRSETPAYGPNDAVSIACRREEDGYMRPCGLYSPYRGSSQDVSHLVKLGKIQKSGGPREAELVGRTRKSVFESSLWSHLIVHITREVL
jgi:hypothetical protein